MIKIETTTEIKKNLSFFIKPLKHRMVFEQNGNPEGFEWILFSPNKQIKSFLPR